MTQIREFLPDDLNALIRMIQISIRESYKDFYTPQEMEFFIRHHESSEILKDAEEGTVLVAVEDGFIIGTGTLVDSYIGRVYILPEQQGMGLGGMLMEILEDIAFQNGEEFVHLNASRPSVDFYRYLGYREMGVEICTAPSGVQFDYVVMEKETGSDD